MRRNRIFGLFFVALIAFFFTGATNDLTVASTLKENQKLLFFEGFEDWNSNNWIVETDLSGTYAITDEHYFEGQYSFQAGPSTCGANCWDHRATITKHFSPPLETTFGEISFYLRETHHNSWGGDVNVWVNGVNVLQIENIGTSWRNFVIEISEDISTIAFEFWDQTSTNTVYLDNISIYDTLCTLDLTLTYIGGTLTMDFEIGTPRPATINVWFNVLSSIIPYLSVPLPPIHPPISVPITIPGVPSLGTIGVLTTLVAPGDGIICSDWETVDTGPMTTESPSVNDIKQLFQTD